MEKRVRRKRRASPGFSVGKNDPLFHIFEKQLYEFNYETRENFITAVVREYIQFLSRDRKAVIPANRRSLLESTIADDVSDMLVRKIYGCLKVEDEQAPAKGDARADVAAAVAAENAAAVLSPQEIKRRIAKLIR